LERTIHRQPTATAQAEVMGTAKDPSPPQLDRPPQVEVIPTPPAEPPPEPRPLPPPDPHPQQSEKQVIKVSLEEGTIVVEVGTKSRDGKKDGTSDPGLGPTVKVWLEVLAILVGLIGAVLALLGLSRN
jgi:hypothetical protein